MKLSLVSDPGRLVPVVVGQGGWGGRELKKMLTFEFSDFSEYGIHLGSLLKIDTQVFLQTYY
jgi:hypothetical protein